MRFDQTATGIRRVTPQAPGLRALAAIGAFWLFGVFAVLFGLALLDRLVKGHGMLLRTQIIAALAVTSLVAALLALYAYWWEHRAENSRAVEEVWPGGVPVAPVPTEPRALQVFVQDGNRTAIASSLQLDISDDRLLRFGTVCYESDGDLSEGRWGPDKLAFPAGINQFRAFRTALQDRRFVARAGAAKNAPFMLTRSGRALVKALAEEHLRVLTCESACQVQPPAPAGGGGGLLEDRNEP
jgi:hypothetical protein